MDSSRQCSIKTCTEDGTFYSYPVYDGHGNMIATLSKDGTGFSFGNQRAFDPWGTVRMRLSGGYAGFPSGRHVAKLGHQMDDESGLVYMRARYYEAGSGRFISEDPAMKGGNWFAYASSCSTELADETGRESSKLFRQFARLFSLAGGGAMIANAYFSAFCVTEAVSPPQLMRAYMQSLEAVAFMGLALVYTDGILSKDLDLMALLAVTRAAFTWLAGSVAAAASGGKGIARNAVAACFAYSLIIAGFLLADIIENS